LQDINSTLLSEYEYTFPLLVNSDNEIQIKTVFNIENSNPMVDIIIMNNREIFIWKSLFLVNLMQLFSKIFQIYEDDFNIKKSYIYRIEDSEIKENIENIQFRYLKREGDYYMIFNGEKEYHFDVGETFSMFKKIFLFSTLYFYKNNNVCLHKLSGLSHREFLKICGINSVIF